MKMNMLNNRHAQCAKIDGFWDAVTRDPGDYQGRHRLDPTVGHQLWLGCVLCKAQLTSV